MERGGTSTQSGIYYQNRIAALYLCQLLGGAEIEVGKRVVAVQVESRAEVDDIEVRYSDGTRRFCQAKETLPAGEKWRQIWADFAKFRFNESFQEDDRLELAIGSMQPHVEALSEAAQRARGAEDFNGWWECLGAREVKAVDNVGLFLQSECPGKEQLFELFRVVSVVQRAPQQLGEWVPTHLPQGALPSAIAVFELLTSLVPEFARIRKVFTRDDLLDALRLRGVELVPGYDAAGAVRSASTHLANWRQTLDDGTWLDRPLLTELRKRLTDGSKKPIVVLGSPGCGKSALLARLMGELRGDGVHVLGLKADSLGNDVETREQLRLALDLPDDPAEILRSLARLGRTVLVIDQLDALSDLMDVHTRRLDVLLRLVSDVTTISGVSVVLSARVVDYRHDVRFLAFNAEEVVLEPLAPEGVEAVLRQRGIEPDALSDDALEMLRVPNWLRWYLTLGPTESTIDNEFGLLEEIWRERVVRSGPACEGLALDLAQSMADREELWVAEAAFSDRRAGIEKLERVDVLRREMHGIRRLAFAHQTFYEFALIRGFAFQDDGLMAHVTSKGDSLNVRPTVSSALSYLRSVDQVRYLQAVRGLLGARPHLRRFTVEYLGRVHEPTDQEAIILLPLIHDPKDGSAALLAMKGNPGWFRRLSAGWLQGAMGNENPWPAAHVLTDALAYAREDVLGFLEQQWAHDRKRHNLLFQTLLQLKEWDERACLLVIELVDARSVDDSWLSMLITQMEHSPELALRVLRRRLEAELRRTRCEADQAALPIDKEGSDLEAIARALAHSKDPADQLLRLAQTFAAVDRIARAAPSAFVRELWPWFREVVDLHRFHSFGTMYGRAWSIQSAMRGELGEFAYSMTHAVEAWAAQDPDAFVRFARREESSNRMAVHAFLIKGFCAIAPQRPADVVAYLMGDPRRLVVGKMDAEASADLLTAVAPSLLAEQRQDLESAISKLTPYTSGEDDPPETRRARVGWIIRLRHSLTACLRETEPSDAPRRRQETTFEMRAVPPRMSTSQMSKASDDAIEHLFECVVDEVGVGTSNRHALFAVSNELKDLVRANPTRGRALLDRFVRQGNESAVSGIIEGLGAANIEVSGIVLACEAEGFRSKEYRERVADTLRRQASQRNGLDDRVCATLRSWLKDAQPDTESGEEDHERDNSTDAPILWRGGLSDALPHGSFPALHALTAGLLERKPPAVDAWMDVLEEHLARSEEFRVWRALALQLRCVRWCGDEKRGTEFLTALFSKHPRVRDSIAGARLIAWVCVWVDQLELQHWLDAMRHGPWRLGAQAYGEIVMLRKTFAESEDDWAARRVEEILQLDAATSPEVVAVAHACSNLWREHRCRAQVTDTMLSLFRSPDNSVAEALMDAFRAELMLDAATDRVMQAVIANPDVVKTHRGMYFVERLKPFVDWRPDRVVALLDIIIRSQEDGTSSEKSFSEGPDLVDLTLTLQRQDAHRGDGLDLFERLIEVGCYGVSAALKEFGPRIGAERGTTSR